MMNFYILQGPRVAPVLSTVNLDQAAQVDLGRRLQPVIEAITSGEQLPFDPSYRPDPGEVVSISPYVLPDPLSALTDPASVAALPRLSGADLIGAGVRALVAVEWRGSTLRFVGLQRLDARYLLKPTAWRLMYARDRFVRDARVGLEVPDRIDAVSQGNTLLIASWWAAHAVLDLTAWTREATVAEARSFLASPAFALEDGFQVETLVEDAWVRRKIGSIQQSRALDRCRPTVLRQYAAKFGVVLHVSKGKVVLPAEKKHLKAVLRLLDEDYLSFEPTDEHWVVNSKRRA